MRSGIGNGTRHMLWYSGTSRVSREAQALSRSGGNHCGRWHGTTAGECPLRRIGSLRAESWPQTIAPSRPTAFASRRTLCRAGTSLELAANEYAGTFCWQIHKRARTVAGAACVAQRRYRARFAVLFPIKLPRRKRGAAPRLSGVHGVSGLLSAPCRDDVPGQSPGTRLRRSKALPRRPRLARPAPRVCGTLPHKTSASEGTRSVPSERSARRERSGRRGRFRFFAVHRPQGHGRQKNGF